MVNLGLALACLIIGMLDVFHWLPVDVAFGFCAGLWAPLYLFDLRGG